MLQVEALFGICVGNANPGDIALADVLDARGAVDEIVDLAFQDRLEVFLHLPSGDLYDDAHVHIALRRDLVEAGADQFNFPIHDLIQRSHVEVFKTARVLAAELDAHIWFAHHLALEG